MIRLSPSSCFLLASLCASTAIAADLPSPLPPPPPAPPVPAFTWTGLYVGGNIGFGGDRFLYPFAVTAPSIGGTVGGSASITSSGVIGGGQVGFNWQFPNNLVLGFETDFDGAAIRGKATADIAGTLGVPLAAAAQLGSRIDYIGTARGRVGYAWNRFLVYATGGFAYGQVNSSVSAGAGIGPVGADFSASRSANRTGWTVGGGFEYAVTDNFTVKTEYLYVDLGTNTLVAANLFDLADVRLQQKTTANIVRAGFNYKFDLAPPPTVVAKY